MKNSQLIERLHALCRPEPDPHTDANNWEVWKEIDDTVREITDALRGPPIYEAESEQLTRPFRDDAERLKALWLYPPTDIAFWKVAYPKLDDFRVAIDRYTKKKQDDKWGYPS